MIAAAGAHNLLMVGPPGSGKSMLAERLPGLLPPLDDSERLEVACIESVAGADSPGSGGPRRRFRAPHHTTPATALVGGGGRPRPGEVSLAHRGVLFLDELPEFSRSALESLREPLESGAVTISRLRAQIRYPAEFQLVAAMNPCPCGYHGDGSGRCECGAPGLARYRSRVSGPLLDRFDLHIEVPRVPLAELGTTPEGLCDADVRAAVLSARTRQLGSRGCLNRGLDGRGLWAAIELDEAARRLIDRAEARWRLSTRSLIRVLRVARTIADLEGTGPLASGHVAEALQYRVLDRPPPVDGL
jgi:magnesium chelatase family protein